jgi:uncharacterized protein DUF1360
MAPRLQDAPPYEGYSPEQERPLGGYAALMSVYAVLTGAFAAWFRASGRSLPERVDPYDLALITVATHKSSRIITKDKVTATVRGPFTEYEGEAAPPGEVSESPRGRGLRRAVGELLVCPYCLSMWIATAMTAGMLVAPRLTRQVAAVFSALFGADLLQVGYRRAAG